MSRAQRLKRVFVGAAIRIEIEQCEKCGGKVKIAGAMYDRRTLFLQRLLQVSLTNDGPVVFLLER